SRNGQAIASLIGLKPEAFVGLPRVESFILQTVGTNLVCQANPSSFLIQIKQNSATFCRDSAQGFIELSTAVTARRTQNIAGEALRVQTRMSRPSPTSPYTRAMCVCLSM